MSMDFYGRKNLWKFILLLLAVAIGGATLFYTESFLKELRAEEVKKANQWAKAMAAIRQADDDADLSLPSEIVTDNTTIPVILADQHDTIIASRNFEGQRAQDPQWLQARLQELKAAGSYIEVPFGKEQSNFVYFQNSNLLTKLRIYPIVLLVVISLFVIIAYLAFSSARKAEQNQVWNGLAKETAHQIGTPLSSLMGWLEMLRMNQADPEMISEMEKDIERLDTITDRFSKIGSKPSREKWEVNTLTAEAVDYLKRRSPRKIAVSFEPFPQALHAHLNKPLYEWVIENLVRNAIDAIHREGWIKVSVSATEKHIRIEVADSGKGISANNLRRIFRPGFSTKKRGWGLGLSLAKRIIESYHAGKISVVSSQLGEGTVFRIVISRLN